MKFLKSRLAFFSCWIEHVDFDDGQMNHFSDIDTILNLQ